MPKLGVTNIQTVYLPSTKDAPSPEEKAWCKVNTAVKIADVEEITNYESEVDQSAYALSKLITEWNLTNADNDEIAPITMDTVKQLPMQDFNFLGVLLQGSMKEQVAGVATPLKESSSSTS